MKGTYTFLLRVEEDTIIEVGSLGYHQFSKGFYAYTGSALGPGGFKRVERHLKVAEGENQARQWHIDYLNGSRKSHPVGVVKSKNKSECKIANNIDGEQLSGFGSSDCDCSSHLTRSEMNLLHSVIEAHDDVSDNVYIEHL